MKGRLPLISGEEDDDPVFTEGGDVPYARLDHFPVGDSVARATSLVPSEAEGAQFPVEPRDDAVAASPRLGALMALPRRRKHLAELGSSELKYSMTWPDQARRGELIAAISRMPLRTVAGSRVPK